MSASLAAALVIAVIVPAVEGDMGTEDGPQLPPISSFATVSAGIASNTSTTVLVVDTTLDTVEHVPNPVAARSFTLPGAAPSQEA